MSGITYNLRKGASHLMIWSWREFKLIERAFKCILHVFKLIEYAFILIKRLFTLIERAFKLIERVFKLIERAFKIIERALKLIEHANWVQWIAFTMDNPVLLLLWNKLFPLYLLNHSSLPWSILHWISFSQGVLTAGIVFDPVGAYYCDGKWDILLQSILMQQQWIGSLFIGDLASGKSAYTLFYTVTIHQWGVF